MNLTDKGIAEIKSAPRWIEEGIAAFEAIGGKLLGLFPVPGECDYVALGDLPSDEEVLAFMVTLSAKGFTHTTTVQAFSTDTFAGVIQTLP